MVAIGRVGAQIGIVAVAQIEIRPATRSKGAGERIKVPEVIHLPIVRADAQHIVGREAIVELRVLVKDVDARRGEGAAKVAIGKTTRQRINKDEDTVAKLDIARHTKIEVGRVHIGVERIDLMSCAKAGRRPARAGAQLVPVGFAHHSIQHDLGSGDRIEGAEEKEGQNEAGRKAMGAHNSSLKSRGFALQIVI